METQRLEAALRHDRAIIVVALAGIAAVAWGYMIYEARAMDRTGVCACAGMAMSGPDLRPWSPFVIVPLFLMWAEMMVAMMIPSAAPALLIFARVNRERRKLERPYVPATLFLLGYLLVWTGFSLFAAVAQWALHGWTLLSPEMASTSRMFSGILLICTGIFQWTRWKRACLTHCRSPLAFLLTDWRDGATGALWMGLKHGAYCAGCCWLLMILLFVAGVMNIFWVGVITVLALLERVVPQGHRLGNILGAALVAWGVWMIAIRGA
jgi:predicted metal-binding membrane protein